MTLTELVTLLKKSKKFILPFGVVILLGVVGIQLLYQRQLPDVKLSPPSISGAALPSSVYLGSQARLPQWADVYQVVKNDTPITQSWAEAVGGKFGLSGAPTVSDLGESEKMFVWGSKKKWLTLGEKADGGRYLDYGLDLLNTPTLLGDKSETLPTGEEAVELVRQFLVGKGFNTASRLVSSKKSLPRLVMVRGFRWENTLEEGQADALRLEMTEELGELPLLEPGGEGLGLLAAYVGRGGKILKLSYSWNDRDYVFFDRYPLEDQRVALTQGKVVEMLGEGLEGVSVELETLSLTSVFLGYLVDSSSGFAHPVFAFQGTGIGKEGGALRTTVLAPAVSSKWLNQ